MRLVLLYHDFSKQGLYYIYYDAYELFYGIHIFHRPSSMLVKLLHQKMAF
ncbi:MAG: hypothetical protein N2166_02590 [candidate division WOR-3 bacterium]|nr:hypothetical protein [candidate division WOR-3 bacterium]